MPYVPGGFVGENSGWHGVEVRVFGCNNCYAIGIEERLWWDETYDSSNNLILTNLHMETYIGGVGYKTTGGGGNCPWPPSACSGTFPSYTYTATAAFGGGTLKVLPTITSNDIFNDSRWEAETVIRNHISTTVTIPPGTSRTFHCVNGGPGATVTNTRSKPDPTPPSISPSCSSVTSSGNILDMRASISYGYCASQSNSASYKIYDSTYITSNPSPPILSGSGAGGRISGLTPNSAYYAVFTASNGCYTRNATCHAVTVTPNNISEAKALTDSAGSVRLQVTNGGGVYNPTTQIQIRKCNSGSFTTVATSTTKTVETVNFSGLDAETCYQVRAVTTTSAGSYTSDTLTFNTPKKGLCIVNPTTVTPKMDDTTYDCSVEICYEWETALVPADITVFYRVKDGYDPTWQQTVPVTVNTATGAGCITIKDLYPNQTEYEFYLHSKTETNEYDSDISTFVTLVVLEPDIHTCETFTYLTELLCSSVKKLLSGNKTIYANLYSQAICDPQSDDPTLLTLWTRILRLYHAMECIVCNMSGGSFTVSKEEQYLVGEAGWENILEEVVAEGDDSGKLVTSGAIYDYIAEKLHSAWHYEGTADVLVKTLDDLDNFPDATTAVVTDEGKFYKKVNGNWVAQNDPVHDMGVWHINTASTIENSGYAVETGSAWYPWQGLWQSMDADFKKLQAIIEKLEEQSKQVIVYPDGEDSIAFEVQDKNDFDCSAIDNQKRTIIFITESTTEPSPKMFTVAFNSAGGSEVSSQTLPKGAMATKPADPTRTGYNFLRWEDEDGNEYNFAMPVTKNINLTAIWEVSVYHDVVFYPNNGDGIITKQVPEGSTVEAPEVTKEGCELNCWKEIDVHTVTFKIGEGQDDIIMTVKDGETILPPESYTSPEGCTLEGWEEVTDV